MSEELIPETQHPSKEDMRSVTTEQLLCWEALPVHKSLLCKNLLWSPTARAESKAKVKLRGGDRLTSHHLQLHFGASYGVLWPGRLMLPLAWGSLSGASEILTQANSHLLGWHQNQNHRPPYLALKAQTIHFLVNCVTSTHRATGINF